MNLFATRALKSPELRQLMLPFRGFGSAFSETKAAWLFVAAWKCVQVHHAKHATTFALELGEAKTNSNS